ncbi:MAG: NrdJb [Spirochaetaceae bacterium]|nr:MAG: NrdJb [Spirochaetaceae bacterium]
MARRIEGEIVDYRVRKGVAPTEAAAAAETQSAPPAVDDSRSEIIAMHEALERPYALLGSTYKVKTPVSDHAMYITINDIVLNEGTENQVRRPFEIFINSKNLDHFQWIVALTRIISAVFRKGGDVEFLVEELKAVFDPRGGYWKTGGKFMPSLIAEIGEVIEEHLVKIGMIEPKGLSEHQKQLLAEKRAEYEAANAQGDLFAQASGEGSQLAAAAPPAGGAVQPNGRDDSEKKNGNTGGSFPVGAQLCPKCSTAAVVIMDGCRTCLNCGDSKCG